MTMFTTTATIAALNAIQAGAVGSLIVASPYFRRARGVLASALRAILSASRPSSAFSTRAPAAKCNEGIMHAKRQLGLLCPLLIFVAACAASGGGTSPTHPTSTFVMDGRIYETAPTDTTAVGGVRIEVADGPSVGRAAASAADGYYRIDGIQGSSASDTVTFNIKASRANYETLTQSVTLSGSGSKDFFIKPSFQTISETLTGEVSGASPVCPAGSWGTAPCQRFAAPVHYDGSLIAWMPRDDSNGNVVRLLLCKEPCGPGDVLDYSTLSWFGSWDVAAYVHAGVKYWVQVMYEAGATPQSFTLHVTRPN